MNYLKPNTHDRTVFTYDEISEKKPLTFAFNLVRNPSVLSDTGSCMYRRSQAVVTHPDYNVKFISYLQLLYKVNSKILVVWIGLQWWQVFA